MARDTDHLIESLAESARPVRPLRRPWIRVAGWSAVAIPYVALVVYLMSPRDDLAAKMSDSRFIIEQLAALGTGLTAALVAFATVVPGYSRKIIIMPTVPLAIWLGSLGEGCVADWLRWGPEGLSLRPDWLCLPAIVLVGVVPAIVMVAMLRRGAPLTPHMTAALGALAAAGLGNFGLRLFHPQDASLMVLVWQFGTVFVLSVLAGCTGRFLFDWRNVLQSARAKASIG
jgi:hypothetical protein